MATYFPQQLNWFITTGHFGYINGEWCAVSTDQTHKYPQGDQIIFATHDSAEAWWEMATENYLQKSELQTPQGKFRPTYEQGAGVGK
jgi:hypothetical protein